MFAHNASGHGFGCQAVRTPFIYYSDKHTNAAIQISPPNLSEGGSLHLPITITSKMSVYSSYIEA